ncbi:hypothetical protein PVK06_012392 [Gossypium arboreum]|uniref:BHLH domain-containing protein n=1 Tax=Gossypium arboreum TaxID=29729 RepID=A0ABR0QC72_GOSAR|nr:hypothetical protein PVK06_012392 [Gossypium arboreum]
MSWNVINWLARVAPRRRSIDSMERHYDNDKVLQGNTEKMVQVGSWFKGSLRLGFKVSLQQNRFMDYGFRDYGLWFKGWGLRLRGYGLSVRFLGFVDYVYDLGFRGNCYSGFLDPFSRDLGPCNGISQSLVLDNEKSELVVKSPVKVGKKSVAEEKVIAALKSHSEVERRRRERINAHLDTLRTLLPYRKKVVQVEYKVEYEGEREMAGSNEINLNECKLLVSIR